MWNVAKYSNLFDDYIYLEVLWYFKTKENIIIRHKQLTTLDFSSNKFT